MSTDKFEGWTQRADFSATEFELSGLEAALAKWQAIDTAQEDEFMRELASKDEEFCSWGFSVTNQDDVRIHIFRNDPDETTFSALVSKNHAENLIEVVPEAFVTGTLTAFFNDWRALLPQVK